MTAESFAVVRTVRVSPAKRCRSSSSGRRRAPGRSQRPSCDAFGWRAGGCSERSRNSVAFAFA